MGTTEQRGLAPSELATADDSELGAESIGRFLSRERRIREIGLDELSALTRLPLRSLERLESGAMDGESDGFTRGLVRTVAEALGLSVDDTLARMLPEARRRPEPRRILPRLGVLRAVPLFAWLAGAATLAFALWFWRGLAAAPPEPLLYRRDAVRELWLLQQQRSTWSPAPALATSASPTVEPETRPPVMSEDGDRSP